MPALSATICTEAAFLVVLIVEAWSGYVFSSRALHALRVAAWVARVWALSAGLFVGLLGAGCRGLQHLAVFGLSHQWSVHRGQKRHASRAHTHNYAFKRTAGTALDVS